jgi:RimJ/RimL family protein N-acetyltransferase
MYQQQRDVYGKRYRLLITDISERNTRSLRAHARVGFEPIHRFYDPAIGEDWIVVAWDWLAGSKSET